MALDSETLAAVLAEVAVSGITGTQQQIQAAYAAQKMTDAQGALAGAITFSVGNWPAVDGFLEDGVAAPALYPLRQVIQVKLATHDATGLGHLLLAFYAATKAHLG